MGRLQSGDKSDIPEVRLMLLSPDLDPACEGGAVQSRMKSAGEICLHGGSARTVANAFLDGIDKDPLFRSRIEYAQPIS